MEKRGYGQKILNTTIDNNSAYDEPALLNGSLVPTTQKRAVPGLSAAAFLGMMAEPSGSNQLI